MINPRRIEVIREASTYQLPTYLVTDDGIVDGDCQNIKMCKGSKDDNTIFRQQGFFLESILEMCVQHIKAINVGELATQDNVLAITHIEDAILRLGKRSQDRAIRNVHGTYKK